MGWCQKRCVYLLDPPKLIGSSKIPFGPPTKAAVVVNFKDQGWDWMSEILLWQRRDSKKNVSMLRRTILCQKTKSAAFLLFVARSCASSLSVKREAECNRVLPGCARWLSVA